MKRPLLLIAGLAAVAAPLVTPAAAPANVFCPVTVAALADVSSPNRPNTFGLLLDVERGDTRSARIRIDSDTARYAVDVDDAGTVAGATVVRSSGFAPLDRAALETAKAAKFSPATFACRPLATTLTLTTGFGT
jgi:TonB family protein